MKKVDRSILKIKPCQSIEEMELRTMHSSKQSPHVYWVSYMQNKLIDEVLVWWVIGGVFLRTREWLTKPPFQYDRQWETISRVLSEKKNSEGRFCDIRANVFLTSSLVGRFASPALDRGDKYKQHWSKTKKIPRDIFVISGLAVLVYIGYFSRLKFNCRNRSGAVGKPVCTLFERFIASMKKVICKASFLGGLARKLRGAVDLADYLECKNRLFLQTL